MFFTLMFLIACSDYAITPRQIDNTIDVTYDPESGVVTTADDAEPTEDDEPIDTAIAEEDSDLDDTPDCWFKYRDGWDYSDGYDNGKPKYVGVTTFPVFTVVGSSAVTVRQGEDVVLDVAISSYENCGDIEINMFFLDVSDFTDDSYTWLKPVNDAAVPSEFENLNTGTVFPSYAAENMRVTPTGDQLFYVWHDETNNGGGYGNIIDAQRIEATEEGVFRLTWTASEYAPIGQTFYARFTQVSWTDVATGEEIGSDGAPSVQDAKIEVTIIE